MKLHEALDQRSEGLALLLYQWSTLKFILGDLDTARALSQRSAAIAEAVFKAGGDQVCVWLPDARLLENDMRCAEQHVCMWLLTLCPGGVRRYACGACVTIRVHHDCNTAFPFLVGHALLVHYPWRCVHAPGVCFVKAESLRPLSLYMRKRHVGASALYMKVAVIAGDATQVMLRTHRLGTIAAAAQDTSEADRLLIQSQSHFTKRLGAENPISGEVSVAVYPASCVMSRATLPEACLLNDSAAWKYTPPIK